MKKATPLFVLFAFLIAAPSANAGGFVLRDGQIDLVSNTTGNQAAFVVRVIGGSGACADGSMTFRESNAGDPDVFKRSFVVALTALATGLPVDAYSYDQAPDCLTPAYIRIKN